MDIEDPHIKSKLIYFYEEQFEFFRMIAVHAMKLAYGKNKDNANLNDLLLLLTRKHGEKPFNIKYEEPIAKHNKTTQLYFSEENHTYFTKYMEKVLPKGLNPKQKKLAVTRIIVRLLVDFVIWKRGNDNDIKEIYKYVMKKNKNLTH